MSRQIGKLKCGLNHPSWDKLLFDATYLGVVMKTGLVTGIISLTVNCSHIYIIGTLIKLFVKFYIAYNF